MFLKFFFKNTDGCTGTFAIAIFNQDNELIDNNTIEILYDDFKVDTACSKETFTNTPHSGRMCRKWSSGDATLIIKINETTITKLGISTWANTSYPLETVTIYGSDAYDGPYDEICTIECNARVSGTYTMVYSETSYTTDPIIPDIPVIPDEPVPIVFQQPSMLNTNIVKNPQESHLFDLSYVGTLIQENRTIQINQQNHYFQVGDVLYYDVKKMLFAKAIAVNNIESEVCGVVSEIIDKDNFIVVTGGVIITNRYTFNEGTPLYLSNIHPGKLVSIEPQDIVKQIATQLTDGIMINIQRGYHIANPVSPEKVLEPYTQDELDEIVKNIW